MPGKINPVICEAVISAAIKAKADIIAVVNETASLGTLQINEFLPLLAQALLEAIIGYCRHPTPCFRAMSTALLPIRTHAGRISSKARPLLRRFYLKSAMKRPEIGRRVCTMQRNLLQGFYRTKAWKKAGRRGIVSRAGHGARFRPTIKKDSVV